ncbi:Conserved_hypothetical protein [Hexamita inflata]|uniref:Uncharacterized protein n=2 Tax=Hexamita inflata TaxID=28002 RepID=A0ABP1HCB5_9EUKA
MQYSICDCFSAKDQIACYYSNCVQIFDSNLQNIVSIPLHGVNIELDIQQIVFPSVFPTEFGLFAVYGNNIYRLCGQQVEQIATIPNCTDSGFGRVCAYNDNLLATNENQIFLFNTQTNQFTEFENCDEPSECVLFSYAGSIYKYEQHKQIMKITNLLTKDIVLEQTGQVLGYLNGILLFDDFFGTQTYFVDFTNKSILPTPLNTNLPFNRISELTELSLSGLVFKVYTDDEFYYYLDRIAKPSFEQTTASNNFGRSINFQRLFTNARENKEELETAKIAEIVALKDFKKKMLQ